MLADAPQQRLLFQRLNICLGESLAGPEDEIDEQAREAEDDHQKRRRGPHDGVGGADMDVLQRPPDGSEPEGNQIGEEDRQPETDDAFGLDKDFFDLHAQV